MSVYRTKLCTTFMCKDSCSCYAIKIVKGNRTLGKSGGISKVGENKKLCIAFVVRCCCTQLALMLFPANNI